jgi:hypothetical protein
MLIRNLNFIISPQRRMVAIVIIIFRVLTAQSSRPNPSALFSKRTTIVQSWPRAKAAPSRPRPQPRAVPYSPRRSNALT